MSASPPSASDPKDGIQESEIPLPTSEETIDVTPAVLSSHIQKSPTLNRNRKFSVSKTSSRSSRKPPKNKDNSISNIAFDSKTGKVSNKEIFLFQQLRNREACARHRKEKKPCDVRYTI